MIKDYIEGFFKVSILPVLILIIVFINIYLFSKYSTIISIYTVFHFIMAIIFSSFYTRFQKKFMIGKTKRVEKTVEMVNIMEGVKQECLEQIFTD